MLLNQAKPLLDSSNFKELIDPSLDDAYVPEEMARLISVATMCIHHLQTSRPTMNLVSKLSNLTNAFSRITEPNLSKLVMINVLMDVGGPGSKG